jgi:CYTH domain-containing protein
VTVDISTKYAHIEQERRFLLPAMPGGSHEDERFVRDRYIEGTRLRLRLVEQAGRPPEHKLGQKVRLQGPPPLAVAHTTVYLDASELALLARLPAADLSKTRRNVSIVGCTMSIDEFNGPLSGLVLAETEQPIKSSQQLTTALGGRCRSLRRRPLLRRVMRTPLQSSFISFSMSTWS